MTYTDIMKNEEIKAYIIKADETLKALGFTEHSFAHVVKVAEGAMGILRELGYSEREIELAGIAGYTHDIGNLVNRIEHSQSGAVMMFEFLNRMGMPAADIADVVTAIGNHDEGTGVPVSAVSAALILADKTDVRRSRVRSREIANFDIHDRVNYSVVNSSLVINVDKKEIILNIEIDTEISSVMDYFEIFLERMLMCRKAADYLGLKFKLNINGQQML